ncbi:MAG: hypothetical protein DCC49_05080 [Acidobacteria bacterium]|nr:MAG: hypothetical protein DCC49_05080 [Acidobacteriota bacterium]
MDYPVIDRIRRLNEQDAVRLAQALIFGEVGRLALKIDGFSMSGRTKAKDQGIDGRTSFPLGCKTPLPRGQCVWQVKSGVSARKAADEFAEKHVALRKAISAGADYVLFWTQDPSDTARKSLESDFRAHIERIRSDAAITFLYAEQIEALCWQVPATLAQVLEVPLGGLVSLQKWGVGIGLSAEFNADPARSDLIESIRGHIRRSQSSGSALHLVGDTGVGKSRLVFEALSRAGIEERVLVGAGPEAVDTALLAEIVQRGNASVVLVVDDCDSDGRNRIQRYVDMASGRIRLVTVGPRLYRERPSDGSPYQEVLPVSTDVAAEIARAVGLGEQDASRVAHLAEGYPGLAHILATAMARGDDRSEVADLVRTNPELRQVLDQLIPSNTDRQLLGVLALFDKLGFEGDLAGEVTVACQLLGVDENALRGVVDRETGRFVSAAGRYRQVTPRLLAVSMATGFLAENNARFMQALEGMPQTLRDRILHQMTTFAGDRAAAEIFAELLVAPPFDSGVLADLDAGNASVLPLGAVVASSATMDAIDRLLARGTSGAVREFRLGRRDMVWALGLLAWDEEHFERAADALLKLAIGENETWGNNATGLLKGLFLVHLGGTAAPFQLRLAWARRALETRDGEAVSVLIEALGNALTIHESRMSADFGERREPVEWRPPSVADEIEARRGAWKLLISIARNPEHRSQVATALAAGLFGAVRRGLAEEIVTDLPSIPWGDRERAELGKAIAHLSESSRSEDPGPKLQALHSQFIGETLDQRLAYVLSLSPWDLAGNRQEQLSGEPSVIGELARDLDDAGLGQIVFAAERSISGDPRTSFALFEMLARMRGSVAAFDALQALRPVPEAAVLGMLRGLSRELPEDWSVGVLSGWIESPDLGVLVVRAAHVLPASPAIASLALEAVRRGTVDSAELGRFLFGGWARQLPAGDVAAILAELASAHTAVATEQALGILEQWADARPDTEVPDELGGVGRQLLDQTTGLGRHDRGMISLYRGKLVPRLRMTFSDRLDLFLELLRGMESFLTDDDLTILDALASERPKETVETLVALAAAPNELSLGYMEHSKILSRLRAIAGTEILGESIAELPRDALPRLVGHIDFSGDEPDPLIGLLIEMDGTGVRVQATTEFLYPEHGWTGLESVHFEERRAVVDHWMAIAGISAPFQEWLTDLASDLDERIASARNAEVERGR